MKRFFSFLHKSISPQDDAGYQDGDGETALRAALRATLPSEAPSEPLRDRIAQMAAQAESRLPAPLPALPPSHPRNVGVSRRDRSQPGTQRAILAYPQVRWVLSAAAILVFFAGLSLVWPRLLSSQALARVEAAMSRVSSLHMVRWRLQNGQRIKESEHFYQQGMFRDEDVKPPLVSVTREGRSWVYDQSTGQVTVRSATNRPTPKLRLSDLLGDIKSHSESSSVQMLGPGTFNGKTVNRVSLKTVTSYETDTMLLLVDPDTDLPLQVDIDSRTMYGKEGHWQIDLEYNQPLNAQLFATNFSGARVVDLDRGVSEWEARLAKPLAQKTVGARTIALRDLQVNERGDVFLLYTAGKYVQDLFSDGENRFAGRDWKTFLVDDQGTRYHWAGDWRLARISRAVDGERLEGDWWVPDTASDHQNPWQPRTFTVRFKVNPRNLHGKEGVKFPPDYSGRASFEWRVVDPQTPLVPAYSAPLNLSLDEESILRQEAQERGELLPGQVSSPELWKTLSDGTDNQSQAFLFSPDGKLIAGEGKKGVTLQEAGTGHIVRTLAWGQSRGTPIVFSPDGQSLLARYGAPGATSAPPEAIARFCLWEVATGALKATWTLPSLPQSEDTRSYTIAPDGKTLQEVRTVVTKWGETWGTRGDRVVEAQDVVVLQHDLLTGRILARQVLPHQGFIMGVAVAGSQIVTSQDVREGKRKVGGLVRWWDAKSGQLLRTLPGTETLDTSRLALSSDGSQLIVSVVPVLPDGVLNGHHELRSYDGGTDEQQFSLPVPPFVNTVVFSPDGTQFACDAADNTIEIRDAGDGTLRRTLIGHGSSISRLAFSRDGALLLSTDVREKTLLWKLK